MDLHQLIALMDLPVDDPKVRRIGPRTWTRLVGKVSGYVDRCREYERAGELTARDVSLLTEAYIRGVASAASVMQGPNDDTPSGSEERFVAPAEFNQMMVRVCTQLDPAWPEYVQRQEAGRNAMQKRGRRTGKAKKGPAKQ